MTDWRTIPNVADRLKWHENKGNLKLMGLQSILYFGLILNGYDGSLLSGLQASDAWFEDLGNPGGLRVGFLIAVSYISGLFAGPLIAYIDENLGRRWGIRFYGYSVLIGSVLGCVAGASGLKGNKGYAIFCAGRAVNGFGLASFLMTSLVMVQEIPHPRSRNNVSQAWDSYYIFGTVIAAWVLFGCTGYIDSSWGWRIPYIIQVPMALAILIAVQFMPETPRFLLGKGKEDEAFEFLVKYHANGDPTDPLVLFEFEEMKTTIKAEKAAKAEKWSVILSNRANIHRLGLAVLMTFLTNMSGSSIIYFYYTEVFTQVGITSPSAQTGINAGLSMFTWVCQLTAVWAGNYIGRRKILLSVWPILLLSLIGLCVSGGVYANTDGGNTHAGIATVVIVWIYLGAFNFANPVLYSYPAEVQTFSMRSKGLLLWNTVTQLESAYVTWVDAVALNTIGYKYYAVYMPLVIIQWFLTYFFMVETKGYTLEEIGRVFEEEHSSNVNLLRAAEEQQPAAVEEDDVAKKSV